MKDYLHRYALYMDNFYNDIDLSKQLHSRRVHTTGTLRANRRNLPNEIKNTKLRKGELVSRYCNGVDGQKWKDKREIIYLSTEHGSRLTTIKTKRGDEKPLAVIGYNKYMGGIDKTDQMFSYYLCERKTVRWNQKL